MSVDPKYALTELFAFAAAAECQFLNMLQGQIDRELQSFESHMEWSLSNLRYYKASLDSHAQHTQAVLDTLRRRDMFSQPGFLPQTGHPSSGHESDVDLKKKLSPADAEVVDCIVLTLVADFEHLSDKTLRLADRCIQGSSMIANHAMLESSKRAVYQAERQGRLTLLAFFFLPLSLTTSFFGMNVEELGNGRLSIWHAVAFSLPVVLLSTFVCMWDSAVVVLSRMLK